MSRKRWIWLAVVLAILGALAVGGWAMRDEVAYARIATGYAAKQTCSCLYVSGRPLESCIAEFPEDARGAISVSEDGSRVRASVMFGAVSADAQFEDGFGCRILN